MKMKHVWRSLLDGEKCRNCFADKRGSVRTVQKRRLDEDGFEIVDTSYVSVIEVTFQGIPVSPTKCPGGER